MICPRCGIENDNSRNFCKSCGNPLASNMIEPIDFGNTQALPVVVKPIEPMSKEEELKNTSVIPVISEEVVAEKLLTDDDEETKKMEAIRDELLYTSEMERVKVNIKQLESVKKPRKKRPVVLIIILIVLFLSSALGITYYLYKKDKLSFLKKEEVTTTTTTTTKLNVKLDTELRAVTKEIIYNSTSHYLKYSYEITKTEDTYKPVLKIYLDEVVIGDSIIQDNSYNLSDLYDAILHSDIYTIEDQVIKGTDKDYYYINISINEKFYVYIINDNSVIYTNTTNMFTTKDPDYVYNNKTSLIKNGSYCYIKKVDEESGIEQISSIENDIVSFTDGETIQGFWK